MAKETQKLLVPNEVSQPVECLGMTFDNDEARREHFRNLLREYLQDIEFRAVEGFPVAESDDEIIRLSDPPYYTACPNPFLGDLVEHVQKEQKDHSAYRCSPYAERLSESRNNSFVNAHSYATKVPHLAVMRLFLHYTEPDFLVLDGFSGTGMAGVAAQLCGDESVVRSLGFDVRKGKVLDKDGNEVSGIGARQCVLSDLGAAATYITANLNLPIDPNFEQRADGILNAVEDECGWMYKTRHTNGSEADITCTIWSDVFVCPDCANEFSFWDAAVDVTAGKVQDPVTCPSCDAQTRKSRLDRAWRTEIDLVSGEPIRQFRMEPALIVYDADGKRYEKTPDEQDHAILRRVDDTAITDWFPSDRLPDGEESRRNDPIGLTHTHHFFTKRNLASLACAWANAETLREKFLLTSLMYKSSLLCAPLMSNYFASRRGKARGGWIGKERNGTLYCPSIHSEVSISSQIRTRRRSVKVSAASPTLPFISTSSTTQLQLPDKSIDYIFTDPPFGANRMYSELNFLWEAWLQVKTNNTTEAIQNRVQGKGLQEYENLMRRCFEEYFRVLKDGRWITVEFSNTKASVWNALQNAIGLAGFVVADVRDLDKQQGSILGYTTATATKQDLAISAYKPTAKLEQQFQLGSGSEEGAWDFIREHLNQLPKIPARKESTASVIAERLDFLLFDRMVSFHVQRKVTVPLSATEFRIGLEKRFPRRDEMYFLPEQAAVYDKYRKNLTQIVQLELFVNNEASAIQWLKRQLQSKPRKFQDLQPDFMRELAGWAEHERTLELSELLEQNFLCFDGEGEVPSQIHSYLSSSFKKLRNLPKADPELIKKAKGRWYVPDPKKEADLEKVRHRALMREFNDYTQSNGKLTTVRSEALRAGFQECWQNNDYKTIVQISERVREEIIQEDTALLMYYDNAVMLAEA